MTVLDGRELDSQNHAQHHFKTGVTEKRAPMKSNLDVQSVGGNSNKLANELATTVKSSVATRVTQKTKQSKKPEIKVKKIFNDF